LFYYSFTITAGKRGEEKRGGSLEERLLMNEPNHFCVPETKRKNEIFVFLRWNTEYTAGKWRNGEEG
jgi:hypothetical protein